MLQVGALHQVELQRDVDRAFDRRAADFAVALRRMRVADREQRARDLDRQLQLGAFGDVAHVHVAADIARRDDAVQAGRGRRHADRAGEAACSGTRPPGPYIAGVEAGVVVPVMQAARRGTGRSAGRSPGCCRSSPSPTAANDSTVTLSASPGLAPSMNTGPVTGLTRPRSSFARSAAVEVARELARRGVERSRTATVSPGAIFSRGGNALFQPWWM